MKLENTFSIPIPAADAWPVLLDLERIAPCVPGATLTAGDAAGFHGKIKVKLGPVTLTYTGIIKVVSQDEQTRVAVLEGGGREIRGNGTAKAVITCRMVESGDVTDVLVETDLAITGKPAQFGRGALAEVAGTLIGQFAINLAEEITASAPTTITSVPEPIGRTDTAAPPSTAGGESASARRKPAEPIDLLDGTVLTGAKWLGLAAAGVALLVFALFLRRRRPGSHPR